MSIRPHSLVLWWVVILVLSLTMSQARALPLHPPHPPQTTSTTAMRIPLLRYTALTIPPEASPLSFDVWFPKVCHDQQILQVPSPRRVCHPPTDSNPILNPTLSLLTCAYAEEGSISAVAAAKHHTTKEMRTSDSNHQEGRWQNKGGRWWSERQGCAGRGKEEKRKGFLSSDSLFHTFLPPPPPLFPQDSSSPTWHMSDWGDVNLPRG